MEENAEKVQVQTVHHYLQSYYSYNSRVGHNSRSSQVLLKQYGFTVQLAANLVQHFSFHNKNVWSQSERKSKVK